MNKYRLANELVLLGFILKKIKNQPNIINLQKKIKKAINEFQQKQKESDLNKDIMYLLCVYIDECVLSSSWGNKSIWQQKTLLYNYYQESWGGEKFYDLVDYYVKKQHIDMLKLIQRMLGYGYQGKYHQNLVLLETIKQRIENLILYKNRTLLDESIHFSILHFKKIIIALGFICIVSNIFSYYLSKEFVELIYSLHINSIKDMR